MRIVGCQKNEYDAVTRYADSNLTCTPFAQLVFDICKSETARVTRPVLPESCHHNRSQRKHSQAAESRGIQRYRVDRFQINVVVNFVAVIFSQLFTIVRLVCQPYI